MLDYRIEKRASDRRKRQAGHSGQPRRQKRKIAALGRLDGETTAQRIDAKGRCLTPGFLDIHRHADAALFRPGFRKGRAGTRADDHRQRQLWSVARTGASCAPPEIYGYLEQSPASRTMRWPRIPWPLILTPSANAAPHPHRDAGRRRYRPDGGIRLRAGAACAGGAAGVHRLLEESLSGGALGISLGLGYAPECFLPRRRADRGAGSAA